MRGSAVLLSACLLAPCRLAAAAGAGAPLSPEEKAFCEPEIQVVERRARIFQAQGLPPREAARKNEAEVRALEECRVRFRDQERRAREQKEDLAEVARRAGPDATEKEREQAWREIRRERLASKSPAQLDAAERAELAAGMQDELAATHTALDTAHARDPAFMRAVHSALACYHRDRKAELEDQIASEESLVKLGTGDRQKLYALRSALRRSDDVLARSREAARGLPGGLERCANRTVAVIAHCLALRFQGSAAEPACEAEEVQQYVRFVK
ncbi:MAG TPA: hypothetical protein VIV57_20225 [Anaeromyxobacter sp.]